MECRGCDPTMQRSDRWPSEYEPDPRSRRNSTSSRGSKKGKKSPPSSASSATSTPKKLVKQPDLMVTGKQILKRPDRANSLPASYRRRPSLEAPKPKSAPPRRPTESPQSSKSRETSLEDDVSLDLSQVSDFEDMNSKYGIKKGPPQATSTPKKRASLPATRDIRDKGRDSRDSARTGLTYRHGVSTDLDYSSVSPEYSGPSSTDVSPRQTKGVTQDMSSCCVSTWLDSDSDTKMENEGEWSRFWANYNGSASVPAVSCYDPCPTPRGDMGLPELDFSADGSRKRSPEVTKHINSIIRNEGLHLTPRETQNMIKCAHILGNVLSKAIERSSKEKNKSTDKIEELAEKDEKDSKKKTMTLDLKETNIPLDVKEEKRSETVTTQTDISLPNTKSAPRIFESILRQLSRSSIDEDLVKKVKDSLEPKVEVKEE